MTYFSFALWLKESIRKNSMYLLQFKDNTTILFNMLAVKDNFSAAEKVYSGAIEMFRLIKLN